MSSPSYLREHLITHPLYPVRVPNGVYPPPLEREGELYVREASPLFNSPCSGVIIWGCLRGASAPLFKNLPLPLIKGKGIQGMGSPNKNLKGVR